MAKVKTSKISKKKRKLPIAHWSHSSLMSFLRNPLAWHKRYVEKIYDTPSNPAGVIGRSGHVALEHFYSGADKETAKRLGLEYLRSVGDFEINFGKAKSIREKKAKRLVMEKDYQQAIGFYLARAPKHKVLGVEVSGIAKVPGHALPLKAISDLVVESRDRPGHVDIVDHKFVDAFSKSGAGKPLFVIQAIFNYYTVSEMFGLPVGKFIVYECKKRENKNGSSQMRRYVLDYTEVKDEFKVFKRLINDATKEMVSRKVFLPNPSDMFEGENSFDIYRLELVDDGNFLST
jgi:hypothetical protein